MDAPVYHYYCPSSNEGEGLTTRMAELITEPTAHMLLVLCKTCLDKNINRAVFVSAREEDLHHVNIVICTKCLKRSKDTITQFYS